MVKKKSWGDNFREISNKLYWFDAMDCCVNQTVFTLHKSIGYLLDTYLINHQIPSSFTKYIINIGMHKKIIVS